MEIKANKLWPEDYELFASMEGHYTSENEKTFFEKVRYKMEFELAPSNDLLLSEIDNEEQIYLVRVDYDEFIVGHGTVGHYDEECHVMNLSEALNVQKNRTPGQKFLVKEAITCYSKGSFRNGFMVPEEKKRMRRKT